MIKIFLMPLLALYYSYQIANQYFCT